VVPTILGQEYYSRLPTRARALCVLYVLLYYYIYCYTATLAVGIFFIMTICKGLICKYLRLYFKDALIHIIL